MLTAAVALAAVAIASAKPAKPAKPGTLMHAFGHGGVVAVTPGTRFFGVAIQKDGKVVAVGERSAHHRLDLILARFTASGRLDRGFGTRGIVVGPPAATPFGNSSLGRAVAIAPNGQILVVGKVTSGDGLGRFGMLVERFSAGGRLDRSFGTRGQVKVLTGQSFGDGYAVALVPGGKIVVAGSADSIGTDGSAPRATVARLRPNGALDTSFGVRGATSFDLGPDSFAFSAAIQRDGKIVIAGSTAPGLRAPEALLARIGQSGTLDRSFNGSGVFVRQLARGASNSGFAAVALQRDGRIVAAGSATHGNGAADAVVARVTARGRSDGSFGSGGVSYLPSAIQLVVTGNSVPGANGLAITPAGEIFVGGAIGDGPELESSLWALTPRGRADGRVGTQGRVLTLYRPGLSEIAALVPAAKGGIIAVGDGQTKFGGPFNAIVASYNGLAG